MKKILTRLFALALAIAFYSCNNSTEPKEAAKPAADTVAPAAAKPEPAPAPAVFKPFDIAEINHSVKDYAKWKPVFDLDSTARKAAGLDFIIIGRGLDKPNNLKIVLMASDIPKAKAFVADPKLKEAMAKGGVLSKPVIDYFHVIRSNPDSKEKQWVVITHKVKDFDAWLKVYDGEGTAARAAEGMVDVVLARGVDDPNTVQLVFDIKDMAKAKAALSSAEKKKLMTSAGVEGAPKIEFYTTAE